MNGILFTLACLVFLIYSNNIIGFTPTQTMSVAVAIVSVLHLFTAIPSALVWKWVLYLSGTLQFVVSSEKKGMKRGIVSPDEVLQCKTVEKKTLVFIRHGESVWNEMFNKGFIPHSFLFRLFRGILREFFLLTTRDSVFYDSPLSAEGESQAR